MGRTCQRSIGDWYLTGPHLAEGKTKEKSLRFPTASKPYYTMLDYSQGHHLVYTNPALHRSLTDPGCWYVSCFPFELALEQSPTLNVEWSLTQKVEWSGVLT